MKSAVAPPLSLSLCMDVHRVCQECTDPAALFLVPDGALLAVNRRFRDRFDVPDPIPPDLTLLDLDAPELQRLLPTWDGSEPRVLRRMTLRGVEGRGRLLPAPPGQALLRFAPAKPRALQRLEEQIHEIGTLERLRALGETSDMIVHEIRTTLSSIHLGVDSVRRSPALDPALHGRLDIALEQLHRLDRLLASIRAYARPRRLSLQTVDLRRTFAAAIDAVEASLQGPRTDVSIVVRPEPLVIRADPDALAEALQNLIVNAVEAQPEGGSIALSAMPSKARRGWVEIRVTDQGGGIPPFVKHRLFQPFFTTKRTGTGLGLALVKSLVELHGGVVSIDGAPGKGTTVRMMLPCGS
jgi:signal transduction histidine kinase